MSRFVSSRSTGRSNADVLIALVRDAEPGRLYPYDDLAAVLGADTDRTWDRRMVQSAVRASNRRMLREVSRLLHPVIGVGYRLSHGADHSRLALVRERRGQAQLRAAMSVLRHVQWTELSPQERALHEAHLTITSAVCAQVSHLSRKQQRQDEAIEALLARVDRLEQG